jgi:hypothetical protein
MAGILCSASAHGQTCAEGQAPVYYQENETLSFSGAVAAEAISDWAWELGRLEAWSCGGQGLRRLLCSSETDSVFNAGALDLREAFFRTDFM